LDFVWVDILTFFANTCYNSTRNEQGAIRKMLKTELAIEVIDEPNIQALSESEQRAFFDNLFARIMDFIQPTKKTHLIVFRLGDHKRKRTCSQG